MGRRVWFKRGIALSVMIMIVTVVAIVSAGCGSSANASQGPLKIGEADNGKAYAVKVGDTIEVTVPGNPTTGYSWMAALAEDATGLLEQVGEPAYTADDTGEQVVGGGGMFTLTFKAVAQGQARLDLVYSRSWEDVEPMQTFTVDVTIE